MAVVKVRKRIKRPEKLNLVPILDSVFIFIFSLLMSAKFLDFYEIGSSLPVTDKIPARSDVDPFNLTLRISMDQIVVQHQTKNPITETFSIQEKEKFKTYLSNLKKKFPKENVLIIQTDPKLPFQSLINVIDSTRSPASERKMLFEKIVFDNEGL